MYRIGEPELKRLERLIEDGGVFRYGRDDGECKTFERDWGKHLGAKYVRMTTSGTAAIYCALIGMGVGPGDEVIVPSCTYMATALAVLAVGAIPVIVDVDESVTLSPVATEAKISPRTKVIMPVHMWGLPNDMNAFMALAEKHNVMVLEDACQSVGGGYEGKMLGAIGHAGAFSFNFYKNMTSGEGGAFVTNDEAIFQRGSVASDCCSFYWNPQEHRPEAQFAGLNFRATEFSGAILNAQLERIDGMLGVMRGHKQVLLKAGEAAGLSKIKDNSPNYGCGTTIGFNFPTEEEARAFSGRLKERKVGNFLPMDTGRHVYTRWDPIMRKQGAHHPALDPFKLKENQGCNMDYTEDMCQDSLDILNRTVLIGMHPDNTAQRVEAMVKALEEAA